MNKNHEKSRENIIFRSELYDLEDVRCFFRNVVSVLHVSLDPEVDFKEYMHLGTKERSFTDAEADSLNKSMQTCIKICKRRGEDLICQLAVEAVEEYYNSKSE